MHAAEVLGAEAEDKLKLVVAWTRTKPPQPLCQLDVTVLAMADIQVAVKMEVEVKMEVDGAIVVDMTKEPEVSFEGEAET